eukprot:GHVU01026096.1.p1 GENE.GHVU01026096.1~~GHVU01026096.1.p1  ORF type:complete len:209 (+),score=35.71 GHVU01026096.1:1494-2120(+)
MLLYAAEMVINTQINIVDKVLTGVVKAIVDTDPEKPSQNNYKPAIEAQRQILVNAKTQTMMFNWDTDIEVRTQEAHRLDVLTAAATGLEDAVKTILNKMAKVVKGFRSGDYGQVETWIQQEWRTKPDKDVRAPIRREFIFKVDRTKPHKDVRAALKSVLKLVDDFKGTYQMKMILAEHVKNNLIKAKITDEMQKQEQRILMVQLYKCR